MGGARTARSRPRSADVNRLLFVRVLADLLDQRFTIAMPEAKHAVPGLDDWLFRGRLCPLFDSAIAQCFSTVRLRALI